MTGKNTYSSIVYLISLIVLLLGLSGHAYSQPDSLVVRPSVGDHFFTPAAYSNLPFTNTHFSTLMGVGKTADLTHKLNLIDGIDLPGLEGELTFLDINFFYQQRVRDWLGAYLNLSVSARVGTELQSILSQGVNTITSFNIGWHIKLVEREKIAISSFIELQNFNGSFISIAGFVKDIIDGVPNPSISQKIPILAGATGCRLAYGINDLIGLKFSGDLVYGESFRRGENEVSYKAAAGIDFDFYPRYSVPVGLVINYIFSNLAGLVVDTNEFAQTFQGKIAYTKGKDFSLGIEYFYQKIPLPRVEEHSTVNAIALSSRFYF